MQILKKLESFISFLLAVANLFVCRWRKVPPRCPASACCPDPYPGRDAEVLPWFREE